MVTAMIREFLEGSTIHGLAHISTSTSRIARAAWFAIVLFCFAYAINMISSSYKDWQESPVSTTITTHPITELDFPTVTVCPPRGSNTAINHVLEKVKATNFTDEERQELLNMSREVFIDIPNMRYAKQMLELLSTENMRSIANARSSLPSLDKNKTLVLLSSEVEGSYMTPGFADPKYKGDFYSRSHSIHFTIELPDNVDQLVGFGENLVVSVQSEGEWSFNLNRFQLQKFEYGKGLQMSKAENVCVSQGGHLASVGSQREQDEIFKLIKKNDQAHQDWMLYDLLWLGGRKKAGEGEWEWLDGKAWDFQNWGTVNGEPTKTPGKDCLMYQGKSPNPNDDDSDGFWLDKECNNTVSFICLTPPKMASGNETFVLNKTVLLYPSLHFWWTHRPDSMTENLSHMMRGFKLSWQIENNRMVEERDSGSKELEVGWGNTEFF